MLKIFARAYIPLILLLAMLAAGCPDQGDDSSSGDSGKPQVTQPQNGTAENQPKPDDPKGAQPGKDPANPIEPADSADPTNTAGPDGAGQDSAAPDQQTPKPVPEKPKPRVAVVDADVVFAKSAVARKGATYIDDLSKRVQDRLAEMDKELEAAPEDKELAERLKKEYLEMQSALDAEQQRMGTRVNEIFQKTVNAYIKEQDLDVVLPKQLVMGVKPDVEITNQIIRRMDRVKVSFTPPENILSATSAAPDETPAAVDADAAGPAAASPDAAQPDKGGQAAPPEK